MKTNCALSTILITVIALSSNVIGAAANPNVITFATFQTLVQSFELQDQTIPTPSTRYLTKKAIIPAACAAAYIFSGSKPVKTLTTLGLGLYGLHQRYVVYENHINATTMHKLIQLREAIGRIYPISQQEMAEWTDPAHPVSITASSHNQIRRNILQELGELVTIRQIAQTSFVLTALMGTIGAYNWLFDK